MCVLKNHSSLDVVRSKKQYVACFPSNPSSSPCTPSSEVTTSGQHNLKSIQNFIVHHKARGNEFTIKECFDAENYISVVFLVRSTFKTNIFGQETLSKKNGSHVLFSFGTRRC